MQRDNSRYCRNMGPLAERSYEVDESSVGQLLSVPMEDLVILGLAPDWNPFAFISSRSLKSPRGKYAFLSGGDADTFRAVYEQSTGTGMKTHAKGNGKPLHVSRLIPFNADVPESSCPGVPEQVPYTCGEEVSPCTGVSVRNPILQSVTDFVMYMTLRYIVSNHSVQGPKLLDTRYKVLRSWIRAKTPLLSGTFYDDKTRMMWVLEFRTSFPVCQTCHREFGRLVNVHLSSRYPAYQPHCSSRCAAKDPRVSAKFEASSMERFGVRRPSMAKEVIEKTRRTLVERYGTDCTFKDERIRAKSMETSRRRYGTDYPAQNPKIAAKSVDTLFRRYGVSTPLRVPEFLAKAKATLRARRGVGRDTGNRECFGLTENEVVRICIESDFPGTLKWPADHPIWDCNVRGRISPREAWGRPSYIRKAVSNMFSMINREVYGVRRDTKFIDSHRSAFERCVGGDRSALLLKVLNRFTIARIAPKVTALNERLFLKIVEESGFDISNGVYCPMAGFGGIVRGTRKWMRDRGIDPSDKVYAADVNQTLCRWYGWVNKDVLSDVVETDRIVVACPPFSDTEQWPGTPAESYVGFHEWARLIREHVRAPGYILIGPSDRYVREKDRNGRHLSPMFAHREQARYYPEYSGGNL